MKLPALVVAVVAGMTLCCGGVVLSAGGMFSAAGGAANGNCAAPGVLDPNITLPSIPLLPTDQIHNAAVIIAVGQQKQVPPRGWVIAVATALQESGLRNLGDPGAATNNDSLGLFQQRPSMGWGTPQQLMDPAYAAGAFYDKLLTVPNWATLSVTQAAQAVQRSAYPDAYAKHEALATLIVGTLAPGLLLAMPGGLEQCLAACPATTGNSAPTASAGGGGCVDGEGTLARAATWLTVWAGGPVPYLSSGDPTTWFGGYRRDCSGYASMALGLPGPGLNTAGLAAHSTPIGKTDLRAGDLLINTAPGGAGHVVIFERWVDPTMTRYVAYEQSGDGGTHHRSIPYEYFGTYPMSPYRYAPAA